MVKRAVVFFSPRSDLDLFPPKLLNLIDSPSTHQHLPLKYHNFVHIFVAAWSATQIRYEGTGSRDFELFQWSKSEKVKSLSFKTHISFIKELLSSPCGTLTEDSFELIQEYIYYVMNRGDVSLEDDHVCSLLSSATNHLQVQIVSLLLEQFSKHSALNTWSYPPFWYRLFTSAATQQISGKWFRIFRLYCLKFGPIDEISIASIEQNFRLRALSSTLTKLPKCQPLLAATAAHNSKAFLKHFLEIGSIVSTSDPGLGDKIHRLIEMMLEADHSIKYPKIETESKLATFADAMYSAFTADSVPFSVLISRLFELNSLHTLQFLLMYSTLARSSLPSKHEQCQLLIPHLSAPQFDFDFIKMILIVIGFDLRLEDLETHLGPLFGNDENEIFEGLRFLLTISGSAPSSFDPFVPWEIASVAPPFAFDPQWPFLLDAGRIILAKHFKIPPMPTRFLGNPGEEACFRDLAWFMTVCINKFRPDLGPDYIIKLAS